MPMVGGKLLDSKRHNPGSMREGRHAALQAAEARHRRQNLGASGRLGGSSDEWRVAAPGQMALAAAEVSR